MKPEATLTALDAAGMLYAVGMGWLKPKLIGDSWKDVYAGDVEYDVSGWRVKIFNDCDCWDYIDSIVAPDGRFGGYSNWKPATGGWEKEITDLPVAPDSIVYCMNKTAADNMEKAFTSATP